LNVMLANDDGFDAPGLGALQAALQGLATLWVVAPDHEHSAMSHAFTLHKPLRATPRGERAWAVSGTPADCVYLGLHGLLPVRPDLVISGINRGGNLGNDVFYSGTVAGAMEAVLQGVSAVSISLDKRASDTLLHWDTAAAVARQVVERALAERLSGRVLLNVNVPNQPGVGGLRVTHLGQHRYSVRVDERTDPWGRAYYWLGGEHRDFGEDPGSDGAAVEAGFASITPLAPDLTSREWLTTIQGWFHAE